MKDIMIIADGIVAKHFLQRVLNDTRSDNRYNIIYYNDITIEKNRSDLIRYFKFDPTSFSKLRSVFKEDIAEVFIVVKKRVDAIETYHNIRAINKEIHIVILDFWHLKENDTNLSLLDANEILSSRLFDFLPNVSVIAQNVGLGIGEIMEIDVPFGSSYVYRHISAIKQKKWRIAAIYRGNKLILPNPSTMIYPNDILLVIGDPNILRGVNISIKKEFGSFPSPYGKNIYALLDMKSNSSSQLEKIVNSAFLLHSKLNNDKLIIKIINPTFSKLFKHLKRYEGGSTRVYIDYETEDFEQTFLDDLQIFNIGLMIIDNQILKMYKRSLYNIKIPLFKIGKYDLTNTKQSVILPEEANKIEKLTTAIFDISSQLDLDINLYDYDPENIDLNSELIEHFRNLATIFKKKITFVKPKENPLMELEKRDDILQFLPFDEKVRDSSFLSYFSKSFQKLYYKLDKIDQIFIPID